MMWARNLGRLFALPLMVALVGCGFHPAYQQTDTNHPVSAAFAQIEIGPINERAGQLLREELQRRLEGAGASVHKIYLLNTTLNIRTDAVAIEFGSTAPSRMRMSGSANWNLVRIDSGNQEIVASGWTKVVDGYNQVDPQYFYSDLQREQVTQRIASAIADQITLQIAAKLNKAPVQE